MSKILYISYDGMTDPLGQSQVLPYIIGLTKKGFSFHLISFEKPDRYSLHNAKIRKLCQESKIEWHPLSYTKNPPVVSTMIDVYKMQRLAKKLHIEHHFSILHCRSYISALIGLRMKKKQGVRFLFDMRGFWADERVDGHIWNLKNPVYKIIYNYFKKKEKQFLKESDHIVSLTHAGKREIISWPGQSELKDKISVIPCCADLESFDPKKVDESFKSSVVDKFDLKDKLVLGYVGSIGTWYMLEEMLLFFKVQQEKIKNLRFLFVTKDNPEIIYNIADKLNLESNSIAVTSSEREHVSTYISLFNWSIFFILPCFSKIASSPTKQGELMSMGIPLIVNSGVGDTEEIVKKYNSGISFSVLNEVSFNEKSILDLNDFSITDTMRGSKEFYDLNVGLERYFSIYQNLK